MNDEALEIDNLIQFPPSLRVVPVPPAGGDHPMPPEQVFALIEHDGRMYDLAALVQHLSPPEIQEIGATAPRSGQEMWDEVVRRWPALAAEIVAGARPAPGLLPQTGKQNLVVHFLLNPVFCGKKDVVHVHQA